MKKKRKISKEYQTWKSMRKRCNNPNSKDYPTYGAAGIKVCEEWNDFKVFLNDMGLAPSKQHSLDRINGKLGYFKSNCKWSTPKEQAINRKTTIYLSLNGKTMTIEEWTIETGLTRTAIERRRDRKWPDEKILTTPQLNRL